MARTPIMAGNWKMNLNHIEATGLVQKLAWTLKDHNYDPNKCECVVIPPFVDLRTVQTLVESDRLPLKYGAQDLSEHDNGAYTGDISGDMLVKLGCSYVIVGHSERRQYHGETDEVVNAKVRKALSCGLTPIMCVGEALPIREAGDQVSYTVSQVRNGLAGVSAEDAASMVLAYEPVWAIGTGRVATPQDAEEVCGAIRATLAEMYSPAVAEQTRIQYGGSVKAGNAGLIMAEPDIDGCLVGGASLNPEEFAAIVRFYDLPVAG
mgnify:CR=1 FL=1